MSPRLAISETNFVWRQLTCKNNLITGLTFFLAIGCSVFRNIFFVKMAVFLYFSKLFQFKLIVNYIKNCNILSFFDSNFDINAFIVIFDVRRKACHPGEWSLLPRQPHQSPHERMTPVYHQYSFINLQSTTEIKFTYVSSTQCVS